MNNYNFSTLNDKEFEQISKDLLNKNLNLSLQSFKSGKDKGIDLRFSTNDNNNSIVVQAKHYLKSGFSNLKSKLKNSELPKVQKLNPDRYILVTSVDLSPQEKDALKIILKPFIKNSNDVIGQSDLNDFLSRSKEIEKKYYKLWLSSTNIISNILNNAVEARTKYFLQQIQKKIKYYVITEKFDSANEILKNEKVLIITGQPGIGKTSLADILLFDRAKNNFKIHKVVNIKEAEDIISIEDKEKQVFYFDDFLGANYAEIINSHKTETQLTNFVERIRHSPNKYLILTTRTVILNYATEKYEKIHQSNLNNRQFELKLEDYNEYQKALILYNHFFHRNIDSKFYEIILQERFYWEIIKHKNYTPRIVEFITDEHKINKFSEDEYKQFILNNLNNPKEIWRYSFNNQIEYLDQCLLLTLFSLGNEAEENYLIEAFNSRLQYEKNEHNQIIDGNQFMKSVKILLNGFISSTLKNFNTYKKQYYSFINPSLSDFLISYIKESQSVRRDLLESMIYIHQLDRFDSKKSNIPLEKNLQKIIRKKVENKIFEKNSDYVGNSFTGKILKTLTRYCKDINVDYLKLEYLKKVNFKKDWDYLFYNDISETILKLEDSPLTRNYIIGNFKKIIDKLILSVSDDFQTPEIERIFEKYNQNFDDYRKSEEGKRNIIKMIEAALQTIEEEETESIRDEVYEIQKVNDIYDDINYRKDSLFRSLFADESIDNEIEDFEYDSFEWEEIIEKNIIDRETSDFSYQYDEADNFESEYTDEDIDDLFEK